MSNNNSNFINVVTDFCADNTGTNDTSAALISAFESISTTGGTVFFPNGVYLIGKNTGKYVEFYSNTHIIGEANVVLRFHSELAGTGQQALLRNHTTNTLGGYECTKNCIIENITFDNNVAIQKKATTVGVGHAQNIIFKNCHWINGNGTSAEHLHYIEFNACKDCKLIDCSFDKAKNTGGTQSEMVNIACSTSGSYGTSDYYVYDNTFVAYTDNAAVGVSIPSSKKNNFIYNNKFVDYESAYMVSPQTNERINCYNNICIKTSNSDVVMNNNTDKSFKLLWNGVLYAGDSQLLAELNDYSLFLVETGSGAVFVAKRENNVLSGGGVFGGVNGSSYGYTTAFYGIITDGSLYISYANSIVHHPGDNHSSMQADSINAIYCKK